MLTKNEYFVRAFVMSDVTQILRRAEKGDPRAAAELLLSMNTQGGLCCHGE